MKWLYILILTFSFTATVAQAQNPIPAEPRPLSFAAWRDQQVLEGQNQVLRASSRVAQLKAGKAQSKLPEPSEVPANARMKKIGEGESLASAELDLKRAQETVESASKLQFDDYVEVYVPTLQDHPEALQKLSEKLSKEELIEILKLLMQRPKAADAKRSASLVGGLMLPTRSRRH